MDQCGCTLFAKYIIYVYVRVVCLTYFATVVLQTHLYNFMCKKDLLRATKLRLCLVPHTNGKHGKTLQQIPFCRPTVAGHEEEKASI